MNFIDAAKEFVKDIGCSDPRVAIFADHDFGVIKTTFTNGPIVLRVQRRPEWGSDTPIRGGKNWNDARYPYISVQFLMPSPKEPLMDYTHYIVMSGDFKRAVLTSKGVIDAASRGWVRVPDDENNDGCIMVQSANVENWTPKMSFFVKTDKGWVRDEANKWEKPPQTPADPSEFLATLG